MWLPKVAEELKTVTYATPLWRNTEKKEKEKEIITKTEWMEDSVLRRSFANCMHFNDKKSVNGLSGIETSEEF